MAKKIIVIGSGFGGLAASLRLKAKGYDVTLVEKHPYLGGRARVFRKGNFIYDGGPTVITAPYLLEELFEFTNNNIDLENNDFKNHLNNVGFAEIIEEISNKSVIRRIGFNPEEIETNDFIKEYFTRTLSHALEILRRNKKILDLKIN